MSQIKHLLPQPQYYKANLHTHSTISDGKLPPAEVKQAYKYLGYQILCLTDHNITVNHSEMTEPDFLMLTGVEVNLNHENYRPGFDGQTYHFNLIAKRPDNLWHPGTPKPKRPESMEYINKMTCDGMELSHTPESVNAMIAKANEKGFLVIYNHPTWSCHNFLDYATLKGLWGVEQRNGECCLLGHNENNAHVIKDLRNLGNRLCPIGADDMHAPRALGKAWTMIGAEELTYDSVINAMEQGDLYMSCGPEINGLWIDGNILKVTCSDAAQITLESHGRFARRVGAEYGVWLREAEFDLSDFFEKANGDNSLFLNLTVTAPDGTYATTRAYYLNELQ